MKPNVMLGIDMPSLSKVDILEKIKKGLSVPNGFFHIVSLNPEIMVLTQENTEFKNVVRTAQILIVDGVGVVWAGRLLNVPIGDRFPGVELMEHMLQLADVMRLRVLLIGGKTDLALKLADCYKKKYPQAEFFGLEGFKNIKLPSPEEEEAVFDIVAARRPHLIFAAFGSPEQELWFYSHQERLNNIMCMGVGGGFDFLSGQVKRAPVWTQRIGLEWLFRLMVQPWRWKRQLRLIKFILLVLKQKLVWKGSGR